MVSAKAPLPPSARLSMGSCALRHVRSADHPVLGADDRGALLWPQDCPQFGSLQACENGAWPRASSCDAACNGVLLGPETDWVLVVMRDTRAPERADTFDYIIIGAGSAGCVLANRLSEDESVRVCLIEAGGRDRNPLIHIPLAIGFLMHHRRLNWRYWTTKQEQAAPREIYIPRGKVLGGSSSINGMVYMRGHRLDYDDWAAAGNSGWSFRDVLPYFKKSENNEQFGDTDPAYHGKGGLMNVRDADSYSPLVGLMCEAAASMQMPLTNDFNGAQQEGFGRRQSTHLNGRRVSTATAFLNPARARRNLSVITHAQVDRVSFTGRRATGVALRVRSTPQQLFARREIIVCGGTI